MNSMIGLNTAFQVQNLSKQNKCVANHFLGVKGCKPAKIHGKMQAVYRNSCISKENDAGVVLEVEFRIAGNE
jgi:hypothetical protein